jgi:DNA-binding NarL/FixJ family response regulator
VTAVIRVLVVDDQRMVAEALGSLLAAQLDMEVVGIAGSVQEAVAGSDSLAPDVVMLDWRLGVGIGADAATAIRANHPGAALLFLSDEDSDEAVLAAVTVGACGYLLKTALGDSLVEAVRAAAAGEMLVPAARLATLLERQRERARRAAARSRLMDEITPREHEILGLMCRGLDNREIADGLGIGYETVRTHVRRLLEKLDARTKLEAVMRAIEQDLVPG